jgi:decaprenyl-phosphate phosphoribosyltransferase
MTMAHQRSEPSLAVIVAREARPRQWLKNVLVFAAPAAAGVLHEWPSFWRAVVAFVAMCAAASGAYFLNDIADVDGDRRHPRKRFRPVAAGELPVATAAVMGVGLLAASLVLAALTARGPLVLVVSAYIATTLAYSAVLKHIAVVDLVAVATGFVLRAVAGAVAVDVVMSNWFLVCISFGSMFIVTGKRYAELRQFGVEAGSMRPSLDAYNVTFLRFLIGASVSITVVSYCLWAFEKADVTAVSWPMYQLSIVPVVLALVRYGLILETGRGGAPEEVFLSDRTLQAVGAVWLALFALGLYRA